MRRVSVLAALSILISVCACAPEGPSAYVTYNIAVDSSCKATATGGGSQTFIPVGSFDIATSGAGSGEYCDTSYYMHLLVNSNLRTNAKAATGRAEPNILLIHSAKVKLMTLDRRAFSFDADKKNVLPNPFQVPTANSLEPSLGGSPSIGIVAVEAIPRTYARQLDDFKDAQILVEVQIFGTTLGDVDIDFKPFVYPLQLCDGCMTRCLSRDVIERDLDVEDFYGEDCQDDSGQDGRVCIDPNC